MELRELEVFVRVAEQGNFSAAARTLQMTPSAASKAVTRLESGLGQRLLTRTSRTTTLTAEGLRFLDAAHRVLDAAKEAEALATATPNGQLRVRSMPTFAVNQLAPLLPAFIAAYPQVSIDLVLGNERLASLDEGADVAIASGELPSSGLVARRLGETRWIICGSPTYFSQRGMPSSLEELGRHSLLGFSMTTAWNHWPDADGETGPCRRPLSVASNQGDMLLALVRSGAGLARLAEYHVSDELRAGRLVALPMHLQNLEPEPLWLLYHQRKYLSPRIRAFSDFVESALAHSPWRLELPVEPLQDEGSLET